MEVKKHKKAKGLFFHKSPEIKNITSAKFQALKDITEYIAINEKETINYVCRESLVLNACKCKMTVLTINTNLL